jgi:hypothetical protein
MQVKTDKDGTFRIERLVPGVTYRLHSVVVERDGRIDPRNVRLIAENLAVTAGEARDLGDVAGRPLSDK